MSLNKTYESAVFIIEYNTNNLFNIKITTNGLEDQEFDLVDINELKDLKKLINKVIDDHGTEL